MEMFPLSAVSNGIVDAVFNQEGPCAAFLAIHGIIYVYVNYTAAIEGSDIAEDSMADYYMLYTVARQDLV